MKNLKKIELPFVVFLTGACVLIIEVLATRILASYYGNTIFTMSSVISIVLAALSVGYYFGGKIADRYPSEKVFYSIILISGISVIFLYFSVLFLLPLIGYKLSIVSGPIISAVVLFFLPSLLLGTLSPFAIKLQQKYFPEKGMGSITGEIFFWSTLGSIFGSLFTGFVLIALFGINQIVLAVAVVLIILGSFPLIKRGSKKKSIFKLTLFSIIGILLVSILFATERKVGVYSHDEEYMGKAARFLQQDRNSSAAMFLDSDELVFDYTKYYVLYKIFKPDLKNALFIGGGAYSMPKALLKDLPNVTVDVAEIEPSLYELAQQYFKFVKTDRLNNYVEDGRRFLHDSNKKYDMIFSDVYYSLISVPTHFTTQEFFQISKDKLSEDGIFVANIIGDLSPQASSLIMSEIKTFQSVFPNSYFFAVDGPDKTTVQNIIFVGYNSEKKIDFNDYKITRERDLIIQSLGKKIINLDKFDFSKYSLLTDDYAPVEYLTTQIIRRSY
jgi:spermidine synthase